MLQWAVVQNKTSNQVATVKPQWNNLQTED